MKQELKATPTKSHPVEAPVFRFYCRAGYKLTDFVGKSAALRRQAIMTELHGGIKQPLADCGFNALVCALINFSGVCTDCCKAELYDRLTAWGRNLPDCATKSISKAEPTSVHAIAVNREDKGAWVVSKVENGTPTLLKGFATKQQAIRFFDTVPLPVHPLCSAGQPFAP